jgi:Bacterial SH3 domain
MAVSRLVCVGLAAGLGACASAGSPPVAVDFTPARAALEDARQAGAPKSAAEAYAEADSHLKEAEQLMATTGSGARDRSLQADGLARLAAAEARCAAAAARLSVSARAEREKRTAGTADVDRLNARLKKSEEEQRRLEERIALLQRDLELTETEIIRTKARLKGIETRAEASSAIAEARILAGRLDPKARSATLSLCNENIAKAEAQLTGALTGVNYGAAVFFAMKAQDIAKKAQEASDPGRHAASDDERPAPQASYRVKAKSANIRKGPEVTEEVLAEAPAGSVLEASAVKGDWVKVTYNGTTGWVSRSVLE